MAKKRKVPLGKAIRWDEAEIDAFLQVNQADIDQMRLLWRKYAPAKYRDLIDAIEQEDRTTRRVTSA